MMAQRKVWKSIKVDEQTYLRLLRKGRKGDSFADIINGLFKKQTKEHHG